MIPELNPESIENSGERAAYRALSEQLPEAWTIRYHYPFCWKDGRRLREGEADFIVIAPGKGIMIVEVKGSKGFDCVAGHWYRIKDDDSREKADNPFEQATRIKHQLVRRLAEKVFHVDKSKFPCTYGHLVMYPRGKVEGRLPNSTEPVLMIAQRDMWHLASRFDDAFLAWGSRPEFGISTAGADKIIEFLADETKGVPVLAANAEEDDAAIEELTRLQFRVFKGLLSGNRVHVTGPAGSGKTLLANWSAQRIAAQGKSVLLTCFNRVLAQWIRDSSPPDSTVEVESFFSLCRRIVISAGIRWNPPTDETKKHEFWASEAPSLLEQALDQLPAERLSSYDAILIDEGQDFHPDWWVPLMLLLKDPDHGQLLVFSDPEQRGVYGKGESYPSGLMPFILEENCRNTQRIAKYCGKIIERDYKTMQQPEGTLPVVIEAADTASGRSGLVKVAYRSYMEMGFNPSQIAILSPFKPDNPNSGLAGLRAMHGLPLAGGDGNVERWRNGECIWASTIKAFKGLEAHCVILVDAAAGSPEQKTEFYVGATRAKHHLTIIPCSSADALWMKELLE